VIKYECVINKLSNLNLIEYFMHISSKWRFYRYLDGTFHVYEMNTPIGKINQLPEYVLKGSNQKALINMKKMLISYVCGDV